MTKDTCARSLLIAVSFGTLALATDFKLIANPEVGITSVSVDELRSVYLQTSRSLKKGAHVEPVMQKVGQVHAAFTAEILIMTPSALWTYYRQLVLTGTGSMPRIVDGDDMVVAYVKKTKGAIGYVTKETTTEGVSVLSITGK
jgi:hypothetical protein